jgi:hypothetical protein
MAAMSEAVVSRVRVAQQHAEIAEMQSIERGFFRSIQQNKAIPGLDNWAMVLAEELSISINQATVSRTGQPRRFIPHPDLAVGTNSGQSLPYTQGALGSINPVNGRVLLISSTGPLLPPANQIDFQPVWESLPEQLPSGWQQLWGGQPEDLHIVRLDLNRSFHRVILNNMDHFGMATYAVESITNTASMSPESTREMWIIDGTALNLIDGTGTMQGREFIRAPASYVYENQSWGRGLVQGRQTVNGDFGQLVDQFLAAPAPPLNQTQFGASQQSIIDAFYLYILTYGNWAAEGFADGGSASHQQVPDFRIINATQTHLDAFSYNITR